MYCQRARRDDETSIRRAREGRNRALDLDGVAQVDRSYLHPERRRHGLNDTELGKAGGYAGIPQHGRSRQAWHNLLEQFQPFAADPIFELP